MMNQNTNSDFIGFSLSTNKNFDPSQSSRQKCSSLIKNGEMVMRRNESLLDLKRAKDRLRILERLEMENGFNLKNSFEKVFIEKQKSIEINRKKEEDRKKSKERIENAINKISYFYKKGKDESFFPRFDKILKEKQEKNLAQELKKQEKIREKNLFLKNKLKFKPNIRNFGKDIINFEYERITSINKNKEKYSFLESMTQDQFLKPNDNCEKKEELFALVECEKTNGEVKNGEEEIEYLIEEKSSELKIQNIEMDNNENKIDNEIKEEESLKNIDLIKINEIPIIKQNKPFDMRAFDVNKEKEVVEVKIPINHDENKEKEVVEVKIKINHDENNKNITIDESKNYENEFNHDLLNDSHDELVNPEKNQKDDVLEEKNNELIEKEEPTENKVETETKQNNSVEFEELNEINQSNNEDKFEINNSPELNENVEFKNVENEAIKITLEEQVENNEVNENNIEHNEMLIEQELNQIENELKDEEINKNVSEEQSPDENLDSKEVSNNPEENNVQISEKNITENNKVEIAQNDDELVNGNTIVGEKNELAEVKNETVESEKNEEIEEKPIEIRKARKTVEIGESPINDDEYIPPKEEGNSDLGVDQMNNSKVEFKNLDNQEDSTQKVIENKAEQKLTQEDNTSLIENHDFKNIIVKENDQIVKQENIVISNDDLKDILEVQNSKPEFEIKPGKKIYQQPVTDLLDLIF